MQINEKGTTLYSFLSQKQGEIVFELFTSEHPLHRLERESQAMIPEKMPMNLRSDSR